MTLSKDEKIEASKKFNGIIIDLIQGMNYFNNSKYEQGAYNWLVATDSLKELLKKVRD